MSERNLSIGVIPLLLTLVACGAGSDLAETKAVSIQMVYSDDQCMREAAGIDLINDENALAAWWLPLSRQQLPLKQLPQSLADIDFEKTSLLVVSMGSRPTPGHAIELYSDQAPVQDASLTIPAAWMAPPADAMLAQLITSPCAVFAVPVGQYENLEVRDREGGKLVHSRRVDS